MSDDLREKVAATIEEHLVCECGDWAQNMHENCLHAAAKVIEVLGLDKATGLHWDGGDFVGPYTAESRERWREEIAQAKRTMSRKEFEDWLYRRVNGVGRNSD